ncbi:hypothetical protein F4808DRAFT_456712 [Astrocystis sublimbata]|nr:hypothetical protein F4808DRAFT_456712 [Astrocystis sublimbata]
MEVEDPDNYYPYPTKRRRYSLPPDSTEVGGALGNEEDDYDYNEEEDDEYMAGVDDGDPGKGTFGVELEFLCVQCPRVRLAEDRATMITQDVHPEETRWLSSVMSGWEVESFKRLQQEGKELISFKGPNGCLNNDTEDSEVWRNRYSRSKLTRVLRKKGLVTIKWLDINIDNDQKDYVHINSFSESEASDDERESTIPNARHLNDFQSIYTYDRTKGRNRNCSLALLHWQTEFENHHKTHNLGYHRTRMPDIERAASRCSLAEWPFQTDMQTQHLRAILVDRLRYMRIQAKQAREDERNSAVDPLHVPVPGLKQQYKAWTVTVDTSVDGNGMRFNPGRYTNTYSHDPFDEYLWYGAEVVSPVLPLGDASAQQAIRDACGCLRDALRCHKPMEVSTGLHVHLGHTKGWTLFQAKRFATFWYLAEKTMLSLHRRDRDQDYKWCAKIGEGTLLHHALFSDDQQERRLCSLAVNSDTLPPARKNRYRGQCAKNVPGNVTENQKLMLTHIWNFNSIDMLNKCLGQNTLCRTGVKWRIRGLSSSLEGRENPRTSGEPGTIEVRIMQGTLDADHINNWVVVLEYVMRAVRDLSDKEFLGMLEGFVFWPTRARLLGALKVPSDVQDYWLVRRRRDVFDVYWQYPDRDEVDWAEPFMVPGHKATHGSRWD